MNWSWVRLGLFWSLPFIAGIVLAVFVTASILLEQAQGSANEEVEGLVAMVRQQHQLVHEDAVRLSQSNAVKVTTRLQLKPQLEKVLRERLALYSRLSSAPFAAVIYLGTRSTPWLSLSQFEDVDKVIIDQFCRSQKEVHTVPPYLLEVVRHPIVYQGKAVGQLCLVGQLNMPYNSLDLIKLEGTPVVRLPNGRQWLNFHTLIPAKVESRQLFAQRIELEYGRTIEVGIVTPPLLELSLHQYFGTKSWQWALVVLLLLFFAYLIMLVWWMRRLRQEDSTRMTLFSELQEGVALLDEHGRIQASNPRMQAWLARSARVEDKGDFVRLFKLEGKEEPLEVLIHRVLHEGISWHTDGLVRMRFPDGEAHWVELSLAPIPGGHTVLVVMDVKDAQQRMIEELRWQAFHDETSRALNVRGFLAAGKELLERPDTHEVCMLVVELQHLRMLNENIGREGVDRLLRQVVQRLKTLAREACPQAVVGRHSSSEFHVLIPCDHAIASQLAQKIHAALSELTGEGQGERMPIKVIVGFTRLQSRESLERLVGRASLMMQTLQRQGRTGIADMDQDEVRVETPRLIPLLQRALEEDRFELYGQRIEPLKPEAGPVRHEVLLRLKDENGQYVSPAEFIPAAERYGLAKEIDFWVVATLLRDYGHVYRQWREQGYRAYPFSINLSGATLGDPASAEKLLALVREHDIPTELVAFEVTETAAIERIEVAQVVLSKLHDAGCTILLDDFGTGQSSLEYLRTLPVQVIKIDGTFVRHLLDSPTDRAIVEASILLAERMGCKSVAEFVEDEVHCRELQRLGVDLVQGYGIEPPRPLTELFPQERDAE